MSQSVKDLINAIVEGDASNIDAAFNSAMAEKVSSKLEDMRISVAQNMFKSPVAEEVAEEPQQEEATEETVEVSEEQTEVAEEQVEPTEDAA